MLSHSTCFGDVEPVRGDSVTTEFFLAHGLAIPRGSLYLISGALTPFGWVLASPLPGTKGRHAVQLKALSRKSARCGYARAAVLPSLLPAIFYAILCAEGPSGVASLQATLVVGGIAAAGLALAGLSYALGKRANPRDAPIRRVCADVLGVAADPARVEDGRLVRLLPLLEAELGSRGLEAWREACARPKALDLATVALLLARLRGEIGLSGARFQPPLEELTDHVLDRARELLTETP